MIAIAIVGLMITSAFGLPVNSDRLSTDFTVKIKKVDQKPQFLQTNTQTKTISKNAVLPTLRGTNLAFVGEHPALGRTASGAIIYAYYEGNELLNIVWGFSTDDGATFDPGVYYQIPGGNYPSIKQWSGQTFYGTFVTDLNDGNGGPTYLFSTTDPTNYDVYSLVSWPWDTQGWHDMIDADIACDSSQNTYEWGLSSFVTSTTYGNGVTDGPFISYATSETQGTISWYYEHDGCNHCDIDIDPVTHMGYAVYDWEATPGVFKLVVRKVDFANIEDPNGYDSLFEITGTGNLIKPSVAAYNDKVVILAETDENGAQDIICLYSNSGDMENLQTSFVADKTIAETNPDIRTDSDGNFLATYTEANNLISKKSDDGVTWADSKQINENSGVVVDEYKCSDLCDLTSKAMWEEEGADGTEIWIGDAGTIAGYPPVTPTITGATKIKPNKNTAYTFTTTDPEGDQVYYYIDWGDGTNSGWQGPQSSGSPYIASHSWADKAAFTIKCKAKDVGGLESSYGSLKISTPRNNGLILRLLDYFQHILPNLW